MCEAKRVQGVKHNLANNSQTAYQCKTVRTVYPCRINFFFTFRFFRFGLALIFAHVRMGMNGYGNY